MVLDKFCLKFHTIWTHGVAKIINELQNVV
jgi:hypothetical protein